MEVNDVDEANRFGVGAGGLVHCDGEGGAIGDLVELLSAEVVEEDVEGEDVLDNVDGGVFQEKVRHGGIVDGADNDGSFAVDFKGEVGEGEVVVEGEELMVLCKDAADVMRVGEGGEEE